MHPEFAPITIISAISLLLPLPWHWRAGNVATLSIIGWLFIINVIYAVDAIIWSDNTRIVIPVWCDITAKLIIGANLALPTACLCVCIHLEQVASVRLARVSLTDKRRRQWFELGMCVGLPMLFMALHYIVQGHRFDIIEGYGCRPTTYYSIPSIFIVWLPPLIVSIAAFIYAGVALRHFMIRRLSFAAHLQSSNSALTPSRYIRLITMSALEMACSISLTTYNFWFTAMAVPIRPWTTWSDVHSNFSRVDTYPDAFTPDNIKSAFCVIWWFIPLATALFVAFFSFGKDAMEEYKKCFVWIRVNIFRMKPTNGKNIRLSNAKHPRGLPISNPIQLKSIAHIDATNSIPPPYSPSRSSFSSKDKRPSLSEYHSDAQSNITRYETFPWKEPKAVGSYTDLSMHNSTVGPMTPTQDTYALRDPIVSLPITPPSPLTPPPENPRRLRELILVPLSPSSPRRLTYPTFHETSPRTENPPQL